jgi:trk system potassium uptake protein TrkH
MNYKLIFRLIGNILLLEALLMFLPLTVSLIYGDGDFAAFLWAILLSTIVGTILSLLKPEDKKFRLKDALAAAAFTWIFLSLFGALPFYFSGCFNSFIDCAFESISGFTTTGATILTNVEILPRGILFWRSFSQWIGGIGVLVFILAVTPSVDASSINLLRAEVTGPSDKFVPKVRETAKFMFLIYFAMTVILILLLWTVGLPLYDSLTNAFSTAGTGGFSIMNASIGAYNNVAVETIITIFMFLFGISFTLYFILLGKNFKKFFKDEELRIYFGIVITAIIIITINLSGIYSGFTEALRYSTFQVTSTISSTAFTTIDFNLWPTFSQIILLCLMITGCCTGSTGGGIKLARILILWKSFKNELNKIFHPRSVKTVTINGKNIKPDLITNTVMYFFIYFVIFFIAVLLISIDGKDLISSTTAIIASLSNIGIGLGAVGPAGAYAAFSSFSKIIISFCMLAGRLEFFPILILLTPSAWKKT